MPESPAAHGVLRTLFIKIWHSDAGQSQRPSGQFWCTLLKRHQVGHQEGKSGHTFATHKVIPKSPQIFRSSRAQADTMMLTSAILNFPQQTTILISIDSLTGVEFSQWNEFVIRQSSSRPFWVFNKNICFGSSQHPWRNSFLSNMQEVMSTMSKQIWCRNRQTDPSWCNPSYQTLYTTERPCHQGLQKFLSKFTSRGCYNLQRSQTE